jgi:hypothetical protein
LRKRMFEAPSSGIVIRSYRKLASRSILCSTETEPEMSLLALLPGRHPPDLDSTTKHLPSTHLDDVLRVLPRANADEVGGGHVDVVSQVIWSRHLQVSHESKTSQLMALRFQEAQRISPVMPTARRGLSEPKGRRMNYGP